MGIPAKAIVSAALAVIMQGEALLQQLGSIPAQTATQTITEYVVEQGISSTGVLSNGGEVLYETFATGAGGSAIASSGTSASGAFSAYAMGGGDVAVTGAASKAAAQDVASKVVIQEAGQSGLASVGGLLSMSLPAWTAAVAPLLGVGIGYEAGQKLYDLNPELWARISDAILPNCWKYSDVMPAYVDKDGQVYVDKDAVDELKNLFEEEGIGEGEGYTSELDTGDWQQPIRAGSSIAFQHYWGNPRYLYKWVYDIVSGNAKVLSDQSGQAIITGESGSVFRRTVYRDTGGGFVIWGGPNDVSIGNGGSQERYATHDGKTAYWYVDDATLTHGSSSVIPQDLVNTGPYWSANGAGNAGWTVTYGTPHVSYPDGLERWLGDSVDYDNLPTKKLITDDTGTGKTIIPVRLPTDIDHSNDPTVAPDPTSISPASDISKFVSPYTIDQQRPAPHITDPEQEAQKQAPIIWPEPNPSPITPTSTNPSQPTQPPPVGGLADILPFIPLSGGTNSTSPTPLPDAPFSDTDGLIKVYNPTASELITFSHWLWVTYADATIDKIWNNPFDGVISLHELYATPTRSANKIYIKSGFLVSDTASYAVPDRYTEINCGSIVIPEFWKNYLDYSPYSKAMIYLPFIGIQELNVDDIVGHAVNVTYRVDSYSGACIAMITVARDGYSNTVYQFSGNCSVQVPIAGGSQAAIRAAQISASAYQNAYHVAGLAGLAGGIASGVGSLLNLNMGGALGGLVNGLGSYATNQAQGQANAISQTVSAKSSVQHSGTFGESFGAMGNKKPYLIIRRPIQVQVTNYNEEYGFPAHKMVYIGDCTGYLRVREVHVTSATATDTEKMNIEQLLKAGVYV